jgi:hypothetical protein
MMDIQKGALTFPHATWKGFTSRALALLNNVIVSLLEDLMGKTIGSVDQRDNRHSVRLFF